MMTAAERRVLDLLAEAYAAFLEMGERHPNAADEFVRGIHQCQHIVMAREAVRQNPGYFTRGTEG